jgi:AraC-like DNA-binding protein
MLSYQITEPSIVQRRQDAEFSMALAITLIREVTGNAQLVPLRMDFEHPEPSDLSVHRELFQCPLNFNQPDNRGYFPHDLLALPVRTADARLFSALQPFLEAQRQRRAVAVDLLSRLGHYIASSLSSGGASLELVARSIGMSPRTLQRRLAEQQVEFSQLVEDVRRTLGSSYVAHSAYSFGEIALLLGYAEASSFSRAFRRWTGQSPQAYRLHIAATGAG